MTAQHTQQAVPAHASAADTVVIGAGLAGLAAADRLTGAGRSCIVLEASDRLGGRTYGQYWSEAQRNIDLGGTWLLPEFATAFRLLEELQVRTYDSPDAEVWLTHFSEGVRSRRVLDADAAVKIRETADLIAEAIDSQALTAAQVLDSVPMPDLIRDWHIATQRYLAGAPIADVDAVHLLIDHDDLLNPEHYATQIADTTHSLVHALAERHTLDIRTESPVASVSRTGDAWEVRTGAGDVYTTREVIVAVPRNVLGRITFDPAPTGDLAELIDVPHVGASRKDWCVLDGVTQHFRVFASEGPFGYFRSEARLSDGGMLAVGLAPQAEGVLSVPELETGIRKYLPDARIRAHTRHDWHDAHWARGTWIAPRPGDFTRNENARSPHPALQFVGGDLCTEFPGTIEGALRTGSRAADRILSPSSVTP